MLGTHARAAHAYHDAELEPKGNELPQGIRCWMPSKFWCCPAGGALVKRGHERRPQSWVDSVDAVCTSGVHTASTGDALG